MNTVQTPRPTELNAPMNPVHRPAPPARRASADAKIPLLTVVPPLLGALLGIVVLLGVGGVLLGQTGELSAISTSLLSSQSAWYLSRASAFVAYILLWLSMMFGLAITNRMARVWPGGPTVADLHEHARLLGFGFVMLHVLSLLGDTYITYTLPHLLIPFASTAYRQVWVGLGQIVLYIMALVTFSFYVRRWIGARTWRALHFLSFAVFVMALVHGLFSGTDSSTAWAFWMYAVSGASVLGMTVYRILVRQAPSTHKAQQPAVR